MNNIEKPLKILIILLFILQFFFVSALALVVYNYYNVTHEEKKEKTEAIMDSYVRSDTPSTNYGSEGWIYVANSSYTSIGIFSFELDDPPDNWENSELSFDFYGISNTIYVKLYFIYGKYNEFEITWLDRPNKGAIAHTFLIINNGIYEFDITNLIEDAIEDGEEYFTVFFNATDSGYFYISSKEGAFRRETHPLFIWIYEEYYGSEWNYNDFRFFLINAIAMIAISVFLIIYIILYNKKKQKPLPQSNIIRSETEIALSETTSISVETTPTGPPILFCPDCGSKVLRDSMYCENCGKKLNE